MLGRVCCGSTGVLNHGTFKDIDLSVAVYHSISISGVFVGRFYSSPRFNERFVYLRFSVTPYDWLEVEKIPNLVLKKWYHVFSSPGL